MEICIELLKYRMDNIRSVDSNTSTSGINHQPSSILYNNNN